MKLNVYFIEIEYCNKRPITWFTIVSWKPPFLYVNMTYRRLETVKYGKVDKSPLLKYIETEGLKLLYFSKRIDDTNLGL